MPLESWVAGALLAALTCYAVAAGADFGGGVWDLLARGPRAAAQRDLIAHAIGPIWEANHVWLILAIVLLFVGFPVAHAHMMIALHVPLLILLLGIVLRGSAFAFRSYDDASDTLQPRWGRIFAGASLVSPVMLGICVGAIASGAAGEASGFYAWLAPFPLLLGGMTLGLFSFLAASYLTLETDDAALREDFRRRGIGAGIVTGVLAFACLATAASAAPLIFDGLVHRRWSPAFQLATGLSASTALAALWARRYTLARACAIAQVVLVLWGWGAAQWPYVIPPTLTFAAAAAPRSVLALTLVILAAGAAILAPSLAYLYRVFKAARRS